MASTTEQGLSTDHSRASADGAHTHGQNPDAAAAAGASRANRFASHDLALFAPVSGSEEEWRFSPVDRLQRLFDGEAASGRIPVEVSAAPGVVRPDRVRDRRPRRVRRRGRRLRRVRSRPRRDPSRRASMHAPIPAAPRGPRIGATTMSLGQLKILQEVITLTVFVPFAVFYMGQPLKWDYLWAGLCMVGAVFFIFRSA